MDKFLFGVASSAYQIEGGYNEDGKSESIWDTFCEDRNNIEDKTDGRIACDSYHRFKEDVALLKELGVNSYRFSISWPRVLPEGTGKINAKGLKYYLDLIGELISNKIEPIVTVYHWDLPQILQDKGGMLNKDFPDWLAEYSSVLASAFKGRVTKYIIINEPQCIVGQGLVTGDHAPGLHLDIKDALYATHNLLKGYGKSSRAIKRIDSKAEISIATTGNVYVPEDKESAEICRQKTFSVDPEYPWFGMSIYLDPIILGNYPEEYYKNFGDILPAITKEDLDLIHQVPDFLSFNNYSGTIYRKGKPIDFKKEGIETADIEWEQIIPESLYYGSKFLYGRYKRPVLVSENGMCDNTGADKGEVRDIRRCRYIEKYFSSLMKARKEGADIKGYLYWSLFDNFEWSRGYSKRFGLVYLPFPDTARIKKDSFYFYKDLVKKNNF